MKKLLESSFAVLFFSSCATANSNAKVKPQKMLIQVGQESGSMRSLYWENGSLSSKQIPGQNAQEKVTEKRYHPTSAQWRKFSEDLDKQKVWNWQSNYEPNGLPIQTHSKTTWRVAIRYDGREVDASGVDAFPPDEKMIWQSEGYKKLCASVKDLIQNDFC